MIEFVWFEFNLMDGTKNVIQKVLRSGSGIED